MRLPQRKLGDLTVSAIGFGAMAMSRVAGFDRCRAVETVHAAIDSGVTVIDTADVYGSPGGAGVNESLVAQALASYPDPVDHVVVATKGGHIRYGDNWWIDGSPDHLRRACEASLRRVGMERLPLYQYHRPDPQIPYAASVRGLEALLDAGLVRRVGISNANQEQIGLAHRFLGDRLVCVQNEFSPRFRSSRPEIELCERLGLAFMTWSPLGGAGGAKDIGSNHAPMAAIAAEGGVSPQRVCLAWELSVSPVVIPIPGASSPGSIRDSVAAVELDLTDRELRVLNEPS